MEDCRQTQSFGSIEEKGRMWEDLDADLLSHVLGRVPMESLVLDVPFVCKSWHKASLNPSCWNRLVFPKIEVDPWDWGDYSCFVERFKDVYRIQNFCVDAFIKLIVFRGCKSSTVLALPGDCSEQALEYIADECPALRSLVLLNSHQQSFVIPKLVGKWKNLVGLGLGNDYNLIEIISNVSVECKDLEGLRVSRASIGKGEALAIVTNLPKIKYLFLKGARLDLENLVIILQGCKDLVHLDVRECIGFETNENILRLSSHIKTFLSAGSTLYDYDDDCYGISSRDVLSDGNFSD